MARGARSLNRIAGDPDRVWRVGLGAGAALFIALFVGGAFAALVAVAPTLPDLPTLAGDRYLRGVVLFTLEQAGLSAILSITGAVPLALALHRTRFPGRRLVLKLFLLPQALPVLVGGLAILGVWGRGGVISAALAALGLPRLDIYGLSGILLAHVFFNMPLATRLLFAALDAVPAESWRLAGQLALSRFAVLRIVEWPAIRRVLPGAAGLVFMICVTSFTLVLVLGGGPGATTLEVEIYQALRTDFDPGRAVVLAILQVALTAVMLAIVARFGGSIDAAATLDRPALRFDRAGRLNRIADGLVLAGGLLFVLSPFAVIVLRGLRADLARLVAEPAFQDAAITSAAVSFCAAALSLGLSLALLTGIEALRRGIDGEPLPAPAYLFASAGSLVLVVPPVVIGAGWFLALRQTADVFAAAPVMVVLTNAVAAMPFVVRVVGPPLADTLRRHARLASHLGLRGLSRFRHIEWPALRAPLGLGFALASALSLGDLGVVALFGNQNFATLPYLLYQRLGSYRTADAAGLALLLGALCLALVLVAERGFRTARRTP